jgi:hypothetical protein
MSDLLARPGQIRVGIALDRTTDLLETAKRLRSMSSVEKVELYVEHSFQGGNTPEFVVFMEAIGSLPKIISLRIRAGQDRGCVQLPFSALQVVLTCQCSSQSLKYLHLFQIDWTMPNHLCPVHGLANLMAHNNHLKEVHINLEGVRKISVRSQQALVHMVQYKNFSLRVFVVYSRTLRHFPVSIRKTMRFYLALNQNGLRQKLLDPNANPSTQQWVDAIIANREQSSIVFYLLSHNPTIIHA